MDETCSALILDDEDRPDDLEDDEALIEPEELDGGETADGPDGIPVTADEEHLLARLMGRGARENGAAAEGDELVDDELCPSTRDDDE